jgi:dTMP kinase
VFVTFEGPEGSGKSTALRAVSEWLKDAGHEVLETREPGAGEVGKKIRDILLHGEELLGTTETFLFLADRSHHIKSIVRPALSEGKVVLCDRHADSTVVYQGHARGMDVGLLRELNRIATDGLKPDLTLLIDLPPEIGLGRITNKDRLDAEPLEFHEKVRHGFLTEAQLEPGRWVVVDGSHDPASTAAACFESIIERLKGN